MTLCKEVTRDQERRSNSVLLLAHCVSLSGYRTLLGFRHLETKLGAVIPALAVTGSSESMMAAVTITWESASEEIWKN